MAKTTFQNATIVTPEFLNKIFQEGGGHNHLGKDEDGSAPKINLELETEGRLPLTRISLPIGSVQLFAGTTLASYPEWLFCHGQEVDRSEYPDLWAVIGTTFGNGDGSATFNLPDFRERFPVGAGGDNPNVSGGSYNVGATGGSKEVTLTESQIPPHTHTMNTADYTDTFNSNTGSTTRGVGSEPTGSAGGGQPHENRPPYLGINFIIRVK